MGGLVRQTGEHSCGFFIHVNISSGWGPVILDDEKTTGKKDEMMMMIVQ